MRHSVLTSRGMLAALLLGLFFASASANAAQNVYTLDANYSATGLSLWGDGDATMIDYNQFIGVQWDGSVTVGHIEETFVGDFGIQATAASSGKLGFDVDFNSTAGHVNLNIPNTVTLTYDDFSDTTTGLINVAQNRSLLAGQTDRIQTVFPNASFSVDAKIQLAASISATVAVFDRYSASVSLNDVRNVLATVAPVFTSFNPFDISIPIAAYNQNNNGKIELFGGLLGIASKNINNGVTIPLNSDTLLGIGGVALIPTTVEYGNITAKYISELNAHSGNLYSATNTQQEVLSVRANLLGIATLLYGLPLNPFQPKIRIGGPLVAELEIISLDAGITLGLQQSVSLETNSYLVLTSNMPVKYQLSDGSVTAPVTQWRFLLPEDGSGLAINIVDKPTDSLFQIFPSVEVGPKLTRDLDLLFQPSFRTDILKVGLSAWGLGVATKPVYTYQTIGDAFATANISEGVNDYSNNDAFANAAVGLESLINADAGAKAFTVAANTSYTLTHNLDANYNVPTIAGKLTLTEARFNNVSNTNITGQLLMVGGSNTAAVRGLTLSSTGALRIDGGSDLKINGTVDSGGTYLLDSQGRRVPGFVSENGVLSAGNYYIAGTLDYEGADITTIGAGVVLRLADNPAETSPFHIHKIQNGAPSYDYDALAHIANINGTLWLDGADVTTDAKLTIGSAGQLTLRRDTTLTTGANFTAPGLSAGTGVLDVGADSVADFRGGTFDIVNSGTLTGMTVAVGEAAGGGQIRYAGGDITNIASTLYLFGAPKPNGYLARTTTGDNVTDALANLQQVNEGGTLSLSSGARQTLSGAFFDNGTVYLEGSGTNLKVTNGLIINSTGILSVQSGTVDAGSFWNFYGGVLIGPTGTINAGTLMNLDTDGNLYRGSWQVGGRLTFTGAGLSGVAADTTLKLVGTDARLSLVDGSGNILQATPNIFRNAGELDFVDGGSIMSVVPFTNTGVLKITGSAPADPGFSPIGSKFGVYGFTAQSGSSVELGINTTLDTTSGATWATPPFGQPTTSLVMNGGSWTLAGDVIYSATSQLGGIGAGTTLILARTAADTTILDPALDLNSGGKVFNFKATGQNTITATGLSNFGSVSGTLELNSLVTLSLPAANGVTINAGGKIQLDPRATLLVSGFELTLAPAAGSLAAGQLVLDGGNLILRGRDTAMTGIPLTPTLQQTTLRLPAGYDFHGTLGGGEIQLGRVTYDGTNFHTDGSGNLYGTNWTNTNYLIRGVGSINGVDIGMTPPYTNTGSITNYGRIYAVGDNFGSKLQIHSPNITNTGYIGSIGRGDNVINGTDFGSLEIYDSTITNHGLVNGVETSGLIDAEGRVTLGDVTLNGGDVYVARGGSLEFDSTVNLNSDTLYLEGGMFLHDNSDVTLGPELVSSSGTTLSLGQNATLHVNPNQPFLNKGNLYMLAGSQIVGAPIHNDGKWNFVYGGVALNGIQNLSAGTIAITGAGKLQIGNDGQDFYNAGLVSMGGLDPALASSGNGGTIQVNGSIGLVGHGVVAMGGYYKPVTTTDPDGSTYTTFEIVWKSDLGFSGGQGTIIGPDTGSAILTNVDNIIQGRGTIGDLDMGVINEVGGTISSLGKGLDGAALTINTNSDGFLNKGLISVEEGTSFGILYGPFKSLNASNQLTQGRYQIGGTLAIESLNGNLKFDVGVPITFNTATAKITDSLNHATTIGAILPAGSLTFTGGADFNRVTSASVPFSNSGTLSTIDNNSLINISGGNFTNYASNTLTGGAYIVRDGDFLFDNADIRTNAASITLGGSYSFTDQNGNFALRNFTANSAGATLAFTNAATATTLGSTAATMTNEGTLAVKDGSSVTIPAAVGKFANSGAVRIGDGSTLNIQAPLVTGFNSTTSTGTYYIAGALKLPASSASIDTNLNIWGSGKITNAAGANVSFTGVTSGHTFTVAGGSFDAGTNPAFANVGSTRVGASNALDPDGVAHDAAGTLTLGASQVNGPNTIQIYSPADATSHLQFSNASVALNAPIAGNGEINLLASNANLAVNAASSLTPTTGKDLTIRYSNGGTFSTSANILVGTGSHLDVLGSTAGTINSGTLDLSGRFAIEGASDITSIPASMSITLRAGGSLVRAGNLGGGNYNYGDLIQPVLVDHSLYFSNYGTLRLIDNSLSSFGTASHFQNYGTLVVDNSLLGAEYIDNNSINSVLRLSGNLSNFTLGGVAGVTIFGPETSYLTRYNTFSGKVTLEAGTTLVVTDNHALGYDPISYDSDSIDLAAGSTLAFGGSSGTPLAFDSTRGVTYADGATIVGSFDGVVIPAGITGTGTLNLGGKLSTELSTFPGSLNLLTGADITVGPSHTTINGTLSGSGALRTTTLNLPNDSTFTGTLFADGDVNIGTGSATGSLPAFRMDVGLGDRVIFNRTGSLSYAGTITGTGGLLVKGGLALTLTGDSTYTGTTLVNAGSTLRLGNGVTFDPHGLLSSSTDFTNNGTVIFQRGSASTFNNSLGSGSGIYVQAGPGDLTIPDAGTASRFRIDGGTLIAGNGGGSPTTTVGSVVNNGTLAFNASNDIAVTGVVSGTGTLQQRGSGNLTLADGQTFTGATRIQNGRITITADSGLGAAPATYNATQLVIDGGGLFTSAPVTLSDKRGVTVNSGGATFGGNLIIPTILKGGGPVTASSGSVSFGIDFASRSYTINSATLTLDNLGTTAALNGSLAGNSLGSLIIAGGGTTFLQNATNTFLGQTTISAGTTATLQNGGMLGARTNILGTLNIGNTSGTYSGFTGTGMLVIGGNTVITDDPNVNFRGSLTLAGTLEMTSLQDLGNGPDSFRDDALFFNGGTLRITGVNHFDNANRGVKLSSTSTINLPGSAWLTLAGPISSTGAGGTFLNVTGTGTLSLAGGGTISSNVNINAGTLDVTGSGVVLTLTGGLNDFDGDSNTHGALSVTSGAKLILASAGNYGGGTTVGAGGQLVIGNGGTDGTILGDILVGVGSRLAFNHSDDVTIANAITGDGTLEQAGTGKLIVSTDQAFDGTTLITSGVFQIGDDLDSGSIQGDIVNNASLLLRRNNVAAFDGDISGTGTLDFNGGFAGSGTTTLGGTLSYTGATALTAGALVMNNDFANAGGITIGSNAKLSTLGTLGGTIANGGILEIGRTGNYDIGFTLTGTGVLVQKGGGEAYFTTTGQTNALNIQSGGLGFNIASGTSSFSGTVGGAGTLLKEGPGTLVVTADSNSFTGNVLVHGGTLQFGDGGTRGLIDTAISLDDDATLAVKYQAGSGTSVSHVISGQGAVHLLGGGLNFLAANTYTGGTTVDSGATLTIAGSEGGFVGNIDNNGTLIFARGLDSPYTFAGNATGTGAIVIGGYSEITLAGTYANAVTIDSNGSLAVDYTAVMSGAVANAGNLTLVTGANSRFLTDVLPGGLSGAGTVTLTGGGHLIVQGDIPWSGNTWLYDGSTFAINYDGETPSVFSRSFFGPSGNFEKRGSGTLVLDATSVLNGDIAVSGGNLEFRNGTMNSLSPTGSYNIGADGTLVLNSQILSPTTLATPFKGSGTVHLVGGPFTLTADSPSFLGTFIVDAGKTLNLGDAGHSGSLGYGTLDVSGTVNLDHPGDVTILSNISGPASGRISKGDAGLLTLGGLLDFDGQITTSGPLRTETAGGSTLAKLTASAFTNAGGLNVGIISSPSITNTYPNTLTITGTNSSASQVIVNRGTLVIGDGGRNGSLAADIDNAGGTLAYNRADDGSLGINDYATVGRISSVTGGTVRQSGTGVLRVYSDQNVFIGSHKVDVAFFEVENGTMEFMSPFATGGITNHAHLIINGDLLGNAPLYGTYDNSINSDGTLTTIGDVNFTSPSNSYTGTLEINRSDYTGNVTLNASANNLTGANVVIGRLVGNSTLHYAGNTNQFSTVSTLTLAGNSTHTGTIDLVGADLFVAGDLASNVAITTRNYVNPATGVVNLVGGSLTFTNSAPATFSGALSGVTGFTHAGTGRLTLGLAVNSVTATQGALALGAGGSVSRLTLGNNSTAGFALNGHDATLTYLSGGGTIDLGANTLTVNQTGITTPVPETGGFIFTSDDTTYSGVINGTGRLVKQGSGSLELSGDNTFSGGIELKSGPLVLSGTTNPAGGYLVRGGTLFVHDASNFGAAPATLRADLITLDGGRLEALEPVALSATQGITIPDAGTLAGPLTINGPIAGSGTLIVGGGRVVFNGTPFLGEATYVSSGTLAIGNLNAIDHVNTIFAAGSAFDVNGLAITDANWPEPIRLQGATLANGSATPVTVSHALVVDNSVGFSGGGSTLTFTGALTGTDSVGIGSSGDVVLDTPSAARIGSISVYGGNLAVPAASLTALDSVSAADGGRLQLTGAARDFTLSALSLNNSTFSADTTSPMTVTTTLQLAQFPVDTDRAYIGGSADLTLAGAVSGATDIAKVGGGTLTVTADIGGWNGNFHQPRFDVQEGTLAMSAAAYSVPGTVDNVPRPLTIGANGTVTLTDSSKLVIRFLSGAGTLDLGANDLEVRQRNNGQSGDGVFTGSVTTTGNVTHNFYTGLDFGPTTDKQSYGTLTASNLYINSGDVTVTNALHVSGLISVHDRLATTTNGISTDGGTILNANFGDTQGTLKLTGGENITGNAGNLVMLGSQANLLDGNGAVVSFGSNSSTGNLTAMAGAVLNLKPTFTNHGTVSVAYGSYVNGAGTINQAGGEFSIGGFTLTAARINVSGGRFVINAGATFQRTGSGNNVLTNPGIVMTGGLVEASGLILGGGVDIEGGTFAPGGNFVVGYEGIGGGMIFGGGGRLAWDISDAAGSLGDDSYDWLDVSRGSSSASKITVNATAANPFTIAVNSATGGSVANFDDTQNYAWTVATTTSGFTGFSSGKFAVDTTNFSTAYTGNFGVATSGTDLQLVYNWSHAYDVVSGTQTASDLGANGPFGGLNKMGDGTLVLNGTNTYTGDTKISDGTLVVDGSIAESSLTTVGDGGTLAGTGTVGALTVGSGGTLSPGHSPGTMHVSGDLTLDYGSVTTMEINGVTAGAYDVISIEGPGHIVTLGGTLNLVFDDMESSFTAFAYDLFDYGAGNSLAGRSFNFVNLTYHDTEGPHTVAMSNIGRVWSTTVLDYSFKFNEAGGGLAVIPEPGEWGVILGVGLAVLALLRRRRSGYRL